MVTDTTLSLQLDRR